MTPPRNVTEPSIDGWTVYRGAEWWEARCNADPSLIVRHANPKQLADACAAINQPPARVSRVRGPLGGINV